MVKTVTARDVYGVLESLFLFCGQSGEEGGVGISKKVLCVGQKNADFKAFGRIPLFGYDFRGKGVLPRRKGSCVALR